MELKQRMVDALQSHFGGEIDIFDIEAAIYWFASDYHRGQWSELYSILSTSEYRPGRMETSALHAGETVQMSYDVLVENINDYIANDVPYCN